MREWLAQRADSDSYQGRCCQHSYVCRQRACPGDQDSHQPTGIARADPGSGLANTRSGTANTSGGYANTSSTYAYTSSAYANTRSRDDQPPPYPKAGLVDFGNTRRHIGPLPG